MDHKKYPLRVCGADVHNDLIVATIQSSDETTLRERFGTTRSVALDFLDHLENKIEIYLITLDTMILTKPLALPR